MDEQQPNPLITTADAATMAVFVIMCSLGIFSLLLAAWGVW